jgi:signal transduction histidine kinase
MVCAVPNRNKTNSVEITTLAESLAQERDFILKRWRAEVGVVGEEKPIEALSRGEFYDHIPDFLEQLCARLRGDSAGPPKAARQHGAHRWQQGLSFVEVIHEWSLLHRVLIEQISALWEAVSLNPQALQQAYWLLAGEVDKAIAASLTEYQAGLRTQAEIRMHNLEAALAHHKDMDTARGQGLHQASHDMRGSLQAIQVSCHLLQKQSLAEEPRTIVERLTQASESLHTLCNDLLDLARLEAGREQCQLGDFDAAALLLDLVTAMQSAAEDQGLTLRTQGEGALPVRSDEAKLRRIAQNLILNALYYTTAGEVVVGWHANPPSGWSFYVQDTGPGMASTQTDPYTANLEGAQRGNATTADTAGESGKLVGPRQARGHGEGIGLAIVHQLCELLDAVLEIDSETGSGTTFHVRLPSNRKASGAQESDSALEYE